MTSPQRFLANNRNILRAATLTPSSVLPVANKVLSIPRARNGSAEVSLTGTYAGFEEATYDVQILDDTIDVGIASKPVFTGAGTGTLDDIGATSLAAQDFTVELGDAGIPAVKAGVDFEGVKLAAKAAGALGNQVRISIDETPLTFTEQNWSTLADLKAGDGASTGNGLEGPQFDFDTPVLGVDGQIPASSTTNNLGEGKAHRLIFGSDRANVYLQYKVYSGGKWLYYFVPELKTDIPAGAKISFVTGGRTVSVTDGTSTVDYTGIVTLYDALNAFKLDSAGLVDVVGVIANDRSPTGQAAQELQTKTDAHAETSTGSGSKAATGFEAISVESAAATELVVATCYAVSAKDAAGAGVGHEFWKVKGTVSGDVGTAITGVPFTGPEWGFTIPTRLPDATGANKGKFTFVDFTLASRTEGDPSPVFVCPVALTLGPGAIDQTITLTYTKRPDGSCICTDMPVPNLDTACLGNTGAGDATMTYQIDTVTALKGLYDWKHSVIRKITAVAEALEASMIDQPEGAPGPYSWAIKYTPQSLNQIVEKFEQTIALIDPLPASSPDYRGDGMAEWATAVTELQDDVAAIIGQAFGEVTVTGLENIAEGKAVTFWPNGDHWEAINYNSSLSLGAPGDIAYVGYAVEAITGSPGTGRVRIWGRVTGLSGLTPGVQYSPDMDTVNWTTFVTAYSAMAISTTELLIYTITDKDRELTDNNSGGTPPNLKAGLPTWGLVADRYLSKLQHVLITAGVSPLGKSDASNRVQSSDGCWQDWNDPFYWEVVGDVNGKYAPAFNNHPYYSSQLVGKVYRSTHEFAFQINEKCPQDLRAGDTITLKISDAATASTYQVGDALTLPIVAAQDLFMAGGQDGDALQKWYVSGSVIGALAQYTYNPAAPTPYSDAGLTFTLTPGGIPFALGDAFRFSIVGGHYRWRKNGGAWSSSSPPLNIPASPTAFDSGLQIAFAPGAAPSFVDGDTFSFKALQPWAVSNLQRPTAPVWKWAAGSPSPTLDADCGSVQQIDLFLMLHTLPEGASITLQGGVLAANEWSEPIIWRALASWAVMDHTARYLRIVLDDATGGSVQWAWAGEALTTKRTADFVLRRSYKMGRSDAQGLIQGGRFLGKTVSGEATWSEGALTESDVTDFSALLDWIKENGDEPIVVIPQITRTDEPVLFALIDSDLIDFPDVHGYQPQAGRERSLSASLQLAGVWR